MKKLVAAIFLVMPFMAVAQRLPGNIVPEHYSLTFTPDLQKATFAGQETIDVRIAQPAASITLNAIELELQDVSITQNGNTQKARVTFAPEKEQATLSVPAQLAAGPASIQIQFTGTLNDKLRGFYLSQTARRRQMRTTRLRLPTSRS